MAVRLSTGLINAILSTSDFQAALDDFVVDLFPGIQPADANNAPGTTAILTFSVNGMGGGGSWSAASGGSISRTLSQAMLGVAAATATPGWIRIRQMDDSGTTNTSDRRIDMSVGVAGADLILDSASYTMGTQYSLGPLTFVPRRSS